MLRVGYGCYLQVPDGSRETVLHPARLIAAEGHIYTLECDESAVEVEPEEYVLIYYDSRRSFVQQPICIQQVVETEPALVFSFRLVGTAASAQRREFFRVSTALSEMCVDLGPEGHCPLLDVSVNGLSISARGSYPIGKILIVRLPFDGNEYCGTVRVQGSRPLDGQRTRYGLLCIADAISGENLQAGLRQVTMSMQRRQLRRHARAT